MNAKINWHREILEFDPGSKVFFPLARLLWTQKHVRAEIKAKEALAVLRYGLDRHPDFMEARLLCVEILEEIGWQEELAVQVQNIADKLISYPSFWRAWAHFAAQRDEQRDFALALNFVVAFFQGRNLSWQEVLSVGLRSFMGGLKGTDESLIRRHMVVGSLNQATEYREPAASVHDASASPIAAINPLDIIVSPLQSREQRVGNIGESFAEELDLMEAEGVEGVEIGESKMVLTEGKVKACSDVGGGEESISLRTRTMADLLAEQGDNEGALDIYCELLVYASAGPEREELECLIERLRLKMREVGPGVVRRKKVTRSLRSKYRLLNILGALAKRLEVRAAS